LPNRTARPVAQQAKPQQAHPALPPRPFAMQSLQSRQMAASSRLAGKQAPARYSAAPASPAARLPQPLDARRPQALTDQRYAPQGPAGRLHQRQEQADQRAGACTCRRSSALPPASLRIALHGAPSPRGPREEAPRRPRPIPPSPTAAQVFAGKKGKTSFRANPGQKQMMQQMMVGNPPARAGAASARYTRAPTAARAACRSPAPRNAPPAGPAVDVPAPYARGGP
jgi:hypothetical protein